MPNTYIPLLEDTMATSRQSPKPRQQKRKRKVETKTNDESSGINDKDTSHVQLMQSGLVGGGVERMAQILIVVDKCKWWSRE